MNKNCSICKVKNVRVLTESKLALVCPRCDLNQK